MKKIMLSLAMALVSVCASAQVYIGVVQLVFPATRSVMVTARQLTP